MEDTKDLNRIKVMLVEKKRTSKWLAEQLGKDPATISKWCTNASQPTLDLLLEIADLLEVDYTELVRAPKSRG
ncbi:MAG: helix-turn-helix transcriptional regulator [Prevotella sp.]|nr:helix-turn-helix transcriptional regulator [Prevotella sp.]